MTCCSDLIGHRALLLTPSLPRTNLKLISALLLRVGPGLSRDSHQLPSTEFNQCLYITKTDLKVPSIHDSLRDPAPPVTSRLKDVRRSRHLPTIPPAPILESISTVRCLLGEELPCLSFGLSGEGWPWVDGRGWRGEGRGCRRVAVREEELDGMSDRPTNRAALSSIARTFSAKRLQRSTSRVSSADPS